MTTAEAVAQESVVPVLDKGFLALDGALASDLAVVNGARVSFNQASQEMTERDAGLIRFLMRERHGCYDDATEVLTDGGWKAWPEVTGEELFATRSPLGQLEYQPALRLIRKGHRGHMIGFKGMSIDLLVTPDHRVLAASTTTSEGRRNPAFSLRPAHAVLWRPHRHLTTARWAGRTVDHFVFGGARVPSHPFLRLVGLFIGDGNLPASNHLNFNLRKERTIQFLQQVTHEAGLELKRWGEKFAIPVNSEMRQLFAACYERTEKMVPRRLLDLDSSLLQALWEGLFESDGSRVERPGRQDKISFHTTSSRLADAVQELALKLGRSGTVRPHPLRPGDGHYGRKDRWRVTIYNSRNSRPALCRTRAQADNHMGIEYYVGGIHCVEVPNGTLYVRRNGYPVWSGNSPFEHGYFRFLVKAPIFVVREHQRHRAGHSFNEWSGRYSKLDAEFYVPEYVRTQVGKPGAYSFEPVDEATREAARCEIAEQATRAFEAYERLLEQGVAKEVARTVLPLSTYTKYYWSCNPRSLMHFCSLRNHESAQFEIREYAKAVELFLERLMPVTHAAFVAAGRIAP